jgi:ABC-type branched-subunit amino acid transport system ATPase component
VAQLEIEGVSLHFGGVVALDDVSLLIRQGLVHAIIGPNGATASVAFTPRSGDTSISTGRIHQPT